MATPTFSSDIDFILAKRAKREKRSVDELLWDRSGREIIRDEVFTETGKMLESKTIPAEIMAAISGESK